MTHKQRKAIFADVRFLPKAAFPVIKITSSEKFHSKKIDITLKEDSEGNQHNGELCVELVNEYVKRYKPLRPLALIFKQFLFLAKLNDPFLGGLSSYGLILFLVSFLQFRLQTFPKNPTPESPYFLGFYLFDLLQFFASCKIFSLEMAPLHPTQPLDKNPINQHNLGYQLIIKDPLNEANIVTKPFKRFFSFESLLYHLFFSLFHEGRGPLLTRLFDAARINGMLEKNTGQI